MPRDIPADIDPAGNGGGAGPINPLVKQSWIVKGTMTRAALEAVAGCKVNAFSTGYASCRFDVAVLPLVEAVATVTEIRLAPPIDYAMDEAGALTYAPNLWGSRVPPRPGLTGKGQIVAIIDTGIDVLHPDFRTEDALKVTRILDAWDMTLPATDPPTGFSYGQRIDNAEIANMINAGVQTALVDTSGHGTLVAGIAVGNGSAAPASGEPAYQYVGIAPEATILVVKLPDQPTTANVVEAVAWAFGIATEQNKGIVCNLSLCSREGPHDGFADLDKQLEGLIAAEQAANRFGRHIVAPVGNDGNTYRHTLTTHPTVHSNLNIEWSVSTSSHAPAGIEESYWIQGWYDPTGGHTFRLQMSATGASTYFPIVEPGTENTTTIDGITCTVRNGVDTVNGKKKIDIRVSSLTAALTVVNIFMAHPAGTGTATVDWYMVKSIIPGKIDSASFPNVVPLPETWKASTITAPGSSLAALCVGGESASSRWIDPDGIEEVPGNQYVGEYLAFSSRGPLLGSATVKPDVVAPGTAFVTTMSSRKVPALPSYRLDRDMKHAQVVQGTTLNDGGTSVSAAFGSGAAALVLQRNGRQSNAQFLAYMKTLVATRIPGAAQDTATQDPLPNNKLGNGKLWLQLVAGGVGVDPSPTIPAPPGTGGGSPGDVVGADPPVKRSGAGPGDGKYMDPQTGEVHEITTGDDRLARFRFALPLTPEAPAQTALVTLRVVDMNNAEIYRKEGAVSESPLLWDAAGVEAGRYYATVTVGAASVTRTVYL